jgi:malate dehydrogenase
VLIDEAPNAAAGKALDIQQAGAVRSFHTRVDGTEDLSRAAGCNVCVIADRFTHGSGEWSADAGLTLLKQLIPYVGDAPIVFAGAAQSDLLALAAAEARIPPRRLMGSAPGALASSVTAIVALEAACSPSDVMLTVLGIPPNGFVIPWSHASISGYALQQVLPQVQLVRLDARAAALWPPGPYALGTAAARLVQALLTFSRRSFSILTQLQGEFGVRNRPGIVSARVGPGGIVQTLLPELTTRERVQLQTALGG